MFEYLRLLVLYILCRSCLLQSTMKPVPFNMSFIIPRIIQGQRAKLGDVPYQIAFKQRIGKSNSYTTFCGGSIITPTKILTAAHCFEETKPWFDMKCDYFKTEKKVKPSILDKTYAVAGNLNNNAKYYISIFSNNKGQWLKLLNGVYPTDYKFPKADIAIITTRKAFKINDHVKPIPMASRHMEYHMPCLTSGYGRLSRDDIFVKKAPYLFTAYMDIVPTSYCTRMHRKSMIHYVCSSSQVPDTAKGDSGGPLVCNGTGDSNDKGAGVLVGVVSGHRKGVGSFFTRVSSYRSFIAKYSHGTRNINSIIYIVETIYVAFCLF